MKHARRLAAALAVAMVLAVTACGSPQPKPAQPKPAQPNTAPSIARGVALSEPTANPRPYGAADTAFGLNVLGAWCRSDPSANLVLSPSSLASGLQARSAALRGTDGSGVTVSSTDQVWTDPSTPPLRSYLNAVATGYGAGVIQVPLLSDPDQAERDINQSIATATRGHIPQLLLPGMLDGSAWVLTDALYLQAPWATPFQPSMTLSSSFTTAAGQQAKASYMDGSGYRESGTAGWTAVSLPYRGAKLDMIALLPPSGTSTCALPASTALAAMTAKLTGPATADRGTATIELPKVNLTSRVRLKDLLSDLGMGIAFTSAANFTALSPQACCIAFVEQAATLQVTEKGTVATAATAVGMLPTDLPSNLVIFDRPYLLLVTSPSTGEPLLLARVANPAAS